MNALPGTFGNPAGAHPFALFDKLRGRSSNICLYGLAPPKLATEPERLRQIIAQQESRLSELNPDGVIVYDIQDESGRNGGPRPFPFLPTLEPDVYARSHLAGVRVPKIVIPVYRQHLRDSIHPLARRGGT